MVYLVLYMIGNCLIWSSLATINTKNQNSNSLILVVGVNLVIISLFMASEV